MDEKILAPIVLGELGKLKWDRLYRLEIQKFHPPAACASAAEPVSRFARAGSPTAPAPTSTSIEPDSPSWRRFGLVYDVHSLTQEQLIEAAMAVLEGESGRFRIFIYYWEGDMVTPQAGRLMGRGQDFLYSDNPQGSVIARIKEPIEFEMNDGPENTVD